MKVAAYNKETGKKISNALLGVLVSFDLDGNMKALLEEVELRFEIDRSDFESITIKEEQIIEDGSMVKVKIPDISDETFVAKVQTKAHPVPIKSMSGVEVKFNLSNENIKKEDWYNGQKEWNCI